MILEVPLSYSGMGAVWTVVFLPFVRLDYMTTQIRLGCLIPISCEALAANAYPACDIEVSLM